MISAIVKKHQPTLDRFFECLPKKPYCTNDPAAGLRVRPKRTAIAHSHIQHNPPTLRYWLTFDIDHEEYFRWENAGLPDPNFIVRNLDNRKNHLTYAITPVCTSDAARPKPMYYCESIINAYTEALKADPRYSGLITKNPYSKEWHCHELHDHVYSLGELADYVELKRQYRTRKRAANSEVFGIGRNNTLFDRTRFWSYDNVTDYRETGNYSKWMSTVLDKAEGYNDFPDPLPFSEIKSTAKSVGKWVWVKYFPEGKPVKRGVMSTRFNGSQLDLDLATKQRLSARRTNEVRTDTTRDKIINAVGRLVTAGKRVSVRAVATEAGISKTTVQKYNGLIRD